MLGPEEKVWIGMWQTPQKAQGYFLVLNTG